MNETKPLTIVVLISGYGTNLQALINAIDNGLPAQICAVISDRADAYGLIRAANANISSIVLSPRAFLTREDYESNLETHVRLMGVDLIVLAGFMQILPKKVIESWGVERIINIHPSLLPKYPGLHTHRRVLAASEKQHGATVHFVNEGLDEGPIIAQASLTVSPSDTEESLSMRIHALEHKLYPMVIDWFAHNRIQLINNRVYLDSLQLPKSGYNATLG